ncbi:MAG: Asp-tRNA(Asn)/Glu-tRNA(Gln) amidotransferase subunit GatC [Acetivibrionales bacterium]|jgi:aspartyl-tRNA(Asn)/glutamyl-tRNA(Gln) amidotransferase subunit C
MKVTKDTMEHVANLARLDLSEHEKKKLASEMESIISFMKKLSELDTSNVKPMEHVMPISNVLREDRVKKSYERDKILANAPDSKDGCFKVPKVVE